MSDLNRREFLCVLGGAGVALNGLGAGVRAAFAQDAGSSLAMSDLRDGLMRIAGAGCNVVGFTGPDGPLLVDSGSPDRAAALKEFAAAEFGAAPVSVLFNTHWHVEHTGGNEALAGPDTRIIAHEHTRLWMSTKFYVEWQDARYSPRPPGALPNQTFFSSDPQPLEIDFGGERVVYGHLPQAHTDGDIYVSFPDRNVIVAGGAVTVGKYPVLDYITGGWVGGLMEATEKLIEMSDDDTLIVPESGPAQQRSDLQMQLEMLGTVRERVEAMALKGQGIDEMIAAEVTKEFDARFGTGAELFISNMYQGLWWNHLRAI